MAAHDITLLAHRWIAPVVETGARAVGAAGRIHAFDIQSEAISRSRERVAAAGLDRRVTWHASCHSHAPSRIGSQPIDAVMFNLVGHAGGAEEERTVREWFGNLPGDVIPRFECAASTSPRAPVLRVVERGDLS